MNPTLLCKEHISTLQIKDLFYAAEPLPLSSCTTLYDGMILLVFEHCFYASGTAVVRVEGLPK